MARGDQIDIAGPAIMLLSAAVFAYFGFMMGLTPTTTTGEFVLFFAILLWTLRISAVLFAASALLTMMMPLGGNVLYAVAGLLSATGLVVVGVMDLMDTQRAAAVPPVLAFIFAAWNGIGAWTGLRDVWAARAGRPPA